MTRDPRCVICWSGPCPEHDTPAEDIPGQESLLDLLDGGAS